jgi:hypothetical protein
MTQISCVSFFLLLIVFPAIPAINIPAGRGDHVTSATLALHFRPKVDSLLGLSARVNIGCVVDCPVGAICDSSDDGSTGCCPEGDFLCNGGGYCCPQGTSCQGSGSDTQCE